MSSQAANFIRKSWVQHWALLTRQDGIAFIKAYERIVKFFWENPSSLNEVFEHFKIPRLNDAEETFSFENIDTMKPLSDVIDMLQKEKPASSQPSALITPIAVGTY